MTARAVPPIPTAIVAGACAIMVALGIWQLGRADEQELRIARYKVASQLDGEVAFPSKAEQLDQALFRRTRVNCLKVLSTRSTASRDANETSGLAQVARCEIGSGVEADIYLGWTQRPQPVDYRAGKSVSGWIAPSERDLASLIADPPAFGLSQLPRPDPSVRKTDHLAYAGQWFLFALSAVVIYALVLRRRWLDR